MNLKELRLKMAEVAGEDGNSPAWIGTFGGWVGYGRGYLNMESGNPKRWATVLVATAERLSALRGWGEVLDVFRGGGKGGRGEE